jgi:RHS repeat-associated protein
VNFRDASGRWQKIDNTLVSDGAGGLRNAAGQMALSLPATLAGPVRVQDGASSIGFVLIGANGSRSTAADTATYSGAMSGVDVSYQALSDGLKETLQLDSATAPATYTFAVTPSAGLRVRGAADGGVNIVDAAGRGVFRIPAPVAEDSSSSRAVGSASGAKYTIGGTDAAPALTVSVDQAWLNDPARVFPVRLDPTTYRYDGVNRTMLNKAAPTTNYSTATTFHVGVPAAGLPERMINTFNVTTAIPPNSQLFGTYLAVYHLTNSSGTTLPIGMYRMTRASTTGATWNTYNGTNAWTTAGGDVSSTPDFTDSITTSETDGYWPNSALVHGWYDGSIPNYGIMLKETSPETTLGTIDYANTYDNIFLSVDYTGHIGDQPQYTYDSHALTDHATAKVNVASGDLFVANNDLQLPAPGMDLAIQRFYNSLDSSPYPAAPLGNDKWRETAGHDIRLLLYDDGYLYEGPSGATYWFSGNSTIGYTTPPGLNAHLSTSRTLTFNQTGTAFDFGLDGRLLTITDKNGNVITMNYQTPLTDNSQLTSIVDTAGRSTTFSYNGANRLTQITDPASRTYKYGYDVTNTYLTSYIDPANVTTYYTYNAANLLSKITDPNGNQTNLGYDSYGRVTSLTQVTNIGAQTGPTTTYAYTDETVAGGPGYTILTDPNGHTTRYDWDYFSRVTKATDALGRARAKTYSPNNDVTTAVDAMTVGNTTTYSYDGDNRASGSTAPTGAVSAITYAESVGTPINRAQHWQPATNTDPDGNKTTFTYDTPGNLTQRQDTTTGGTTATANYTYNPQAGGTMICGGKPGQVCTSTDGISTHITTYHYDTSGQLDLVTPPSPLGTNSYTYDSVGRILTSTDGKGQVSRYTYDTLDHVTQVRFNGTTTCTGTDISNGLCVTNGYDNDGNKTSSVDQTGTNTWGYDALSRETSRSLPSTGTTSLTYDNAGNVLTAVDASGTITYTYDNANELLALLEPGGNCAANPKDRCTVFTYDNNGRRKTTTYPTGATTTVMTSTYDNSGRVTNINAVRGANPAYSDLSYTYSRLVSGTPTDGLLTRTRTDNTATGTAGKTTTYGYDSLARLISAVEKDTGGTTTTASWAYSYDNAGNRLSATLSPQGTGSTTAFTYNNANEIITRAGSSTGWSYDANGAETAAVGAATRSAGSWNPKLQNTSTTVGGTAQARTYTGTGNKLRLTAGSISYRNTALGVTGQTISGSTDNYVREPDGTLIALHTAAGASYYYVYDGLGSVVAIVKSDGTKANSYSYDPYGQDRAKSETVTNPWRYTGGYLDGSTGLYKLGIRYYDPTLGRFTQPDPTGSDPQYLYVGDHPTSDMDPTGECGLYAALCSLAALGTSTVRRSVNAVTRCATSARCVTRAGKYVALTGIGVAAGGVLLAAGGGGLVFLVGGSTGAFDAILGGSLIGGGITTLVGSGFGIGGAIVGR